MTLSLLIIGRRREEEDNGKQRERDKDVKINKKVFN